MMGRKALGRRWAYVLLGCVFSLFVGKATASSTTQAISSNDIVLGMSAPFSGASSGLGVELYQGAKAYFDYVNKAGGINGRKIRIMALDDGYNPAPALRNTTRFMRDASVLCLFGYVGTPTVTRVLPLLKASGVQGKLLFFPFTGAQPQREKPYAQYVFNLRASYSQEIGALVDFCMHMQQKRIAIVYQSDAYGRSGWESLRRALRGYRLDIVSEATYRRGATSHDSMRQQVEIIAEGKPDVILVVASYSASAAFIRDARCMGIAAPIANISFAGNENLLLELQRLGKELDMDLTKGLLNTQVVPSYENTKMKAIQLYRALMAESVLSAPHSNEECTPLRLSNTSLEGFLNAMVMTQILKRYFAVPGRSLLAAAEGLHSYDIGAGFTVSFSKGEHQGGGKVYLTTVQQGRFVPLTKREWQQWQE